MVVVLAGGLAAVRASDVDETGATKVLFHLQHSLVLCVDMCGARACAVMQIGAYLSCAHQF